jgi:DNA-binding CsgD family transcriptional regulator
MELAAVVREAILWEKKMDSRHLNLDACLTTREIEIIKMVASEMNSKEIGEALFISNRTVEQHRKRIMDKTSSKNFIGVVLYALRTNLIELPEVKVF